ncbi:hypothetical protein CSV63_15420 [Sporosarcina sp. P34]|uniref:hypothetical protein n=1 Tax=Sporosarcina sp. P34 TaxID=2048247 RepID=UPI000C1647B4|nr:hypothetical protein [Sporosarcina sp. P34]PID13901.1 hypothetical protein CSV63_15420 [Sporosarcina sp. P34]
MKKIVSLVITCLVLGFSVFFLANSADAANGDAPNGLYKFSEKQEYISLDRFTGKNLKGKVSILTDNYYLILNGNAYKTLDILTKSNEKLDASKITVTQLEDQMDVQIESDGSISPKPDATSFEVESIE